VYVLIVLLTNAATMAQQIQPTWTRPRPNTNRRLVRLSKNLSNAPPVSSVRRHIVGHALDMQGKSSHPTAFTDCTVARDMPMVGDPLAPASLPLWLRRLQGPNHLLPEGRSELRTAFLHITGSSVRIAAYSDGAASGERE